MSEDDLPGECGSWFFAEADYLWTNRSGGSPSRYKTGVIGSNIPTSMSRYGHNGHGLGIKLNGVLITNKILLHY